MRENFKVELMNEVDNFLSRLDAKARKKIIYNIRKAQIVNDSELFKKLNENVWEFRTLHNRTHYRLFAFWDKTDGRENSCYFDAWNRKENGQNTSNGN